MPKILKTILLAQKNKKSKRSIKIVLANPHFFDRMGLGYSTNYFSAQDS